MNTSRVRILAGLSVFGGQGAQISIHDDQIRFEAPDGASFEVDAAEIRRGSFNTLNGMWVLKLRDGRKVRFQGAGAMLSADSSPAGKLTNELLLALLKKHRAGRFTI
ncbi:MAG: hypothetical protein ACT4PP_10005 [Sporichthyaceae bacterium]